MASKGTGIDARAFKDLPVGTPTEGPIDLSELAERIRRSKNGQKSAGTRPILERKGESASADGPAWPPLPISGGATISAHARSVFNELESRYKSAQETNNLAAWQQVRDFLMENLGRLVETRQVTFRDVMNAALDIDAKIIKGREQDVSDPLALYEAWWTKPDVGSVCEKCGQPVKAVEQ